jgi:hypothetical protein
VSYTIYCDNEIEGRWFKQLSASFSTADIAKIQSRGENPQVVNDLVKYDRPDIILLNNDIPVLVVEKTREVPTGHNVGQRVARLVRALEEGVSTIVFFPFDAKKHGDYSSMCNMNIRLIKAMQIMDSIHNTPILAINWPADNYGELVDDGSEDQDIATIVDSYVRSGFDPQCNSFQEQKSVMNDEYNRRLNNHPKYGDPPPSAIIQNTEDFLSSLVADYPVSELEPLRKRSESLVYLMKMTPAKCKRQDPYTGTQFIYDYIWCRNGPLPVQKTRNLILHFPLIKKETWNELNPNDSSGKTCNWYLTANGMTFEDGCLLVRE